MYRNSRPATWSNPAIQGHYEREEKMMTIFHKTKRGGHIGHTFSNVDDAKNHLVKLHKQHIDAIARDGDYVTARVWKMDGHWNWFIDPDAFDRCEVS